MKRSGHSDAAAIWACPRCRGGLERSTDEFVCGDCGAGYSIVAGIPDFRRNTAARNGIEEEYDRVRRLNADARHLSAGELVFRFFSSRPSFSPSNARSRTRSIVDGPDRLSGEIEGWLRPCMPDGGPVFDLGCGAGQLLVALRRAGHPALGVDLSLDLLVIARALLREEGLEASLAAGEAEALPLRNASVPAVVSLDVIEHVEDPAPYLAEIDRVLTVGGSLALSTPNRFSLAAEPHVSVWGVGWLPRRLQRPYVEWRTEKSYEGVRLLGQRELRRLVEEHTSLDPEILVPPIPDEEIEHFPVYRRFLARLYNRLLRSSVVRFLIRPVAPFYRLRAFEAASDHQRAGRPRLGSDGGPSDGR